jgi:tripartite-type tricarboxylate transporter receptor subunit TctC
MKQRLANQGVEPGTFTPAQTDAFLANEITKWSGVIQRAGIKVD